MSQERLNDLAEDKDGNMRPTVHDSSHLLDYGDPESHTTTIDFGVARIREVVWELVKRTCMIPKLSLELEHIVRHVSR